MPGGFGWASRSALHEPAFAHVGDPFLQIHIQGFSDAAGQGHNEHPFRKFVVIPLLQGLQKARFHPELLAQGIQG
jgi:hypothetical protein